MPERIVTLAKNVSKLVNSNVENIQRITKATKLLAINAMIESAHAGSAGRGFSIVAKEVGTISDKITTISDQLSVNLRSKIDELETVGNKLISQVRGTRLTDLALNMIEIIDRNLYERSCDVRWWATDSSVVSCIAEDSPENRVHTSQRLGVILDAYTVYLDLWIVDRNGIVLANGRPDKYPQVNQLNVSNTAWFKNAMKTSSGADFVVDDVSLNPSLNNRSVATYAAAIRENGEANGRAIGVLGIFFDWQSQSQTVVDGVRLSDDEKEKTRSLLLDSRHKVIASSDKKGVLSEVFSLDVQSGEGTMGCYQDDDGTIVGYALTPGYETYKGLGWLGVIVQTK